MKKFRQAVISVVLVVLILTAGGCTGSAGVGVDSASVNNSGHLMLTLSSGTTLDAGNVVGATGATGATGPAGATGATGPAGPAGSSSGSLGVVDKAQRVHYSPSLI